MVKENVLSWNLSLIHITINVNGDTKYSNKPKHAQFFAVASLRGRLRRADLALY